MQRFAPTLRQAVFVILAITVFFVVTAGTIRSSARYVAASTRFCENPVDNRPFLHPSKVCTFFTYGYGPRAEDFRGYFQSKVLELPIFPGSRILSFEIKGPETRGEGRLLEVLEISSNASLAALESWYRQQLGNEFSSASELPNEISQEPWWSRLVLPTAGIRVVLNAKDSKGDRGVVISSGLNAKSFRVVLFRLSHGHKMPEQVVPDHPGKNPLIYRW